MKSLIAISQHAASGRLSSAARVVVAVVGGYILTYEAVSALAVLLPFQPAEATLTATMLSFSIYAGIVVSVFAVRRLWLAFAYLLLAVGVARLVVWGFAA